jgi:hypothetical protein
MSIGRAFRWVGLLLVAIIPASLLALAIAPVTVVAPIQRLSLIFRLLFGWILKTTTC